jgi:hypothetical protein
MEGREVGRDCSRQSGQAHREPATEMLSPMALTESDAVHAFPQRWS